MGSIIKAEGLVLAINDGTNIYPIGCAKNTSITLTADYHELAPKTNNLFREYLPNRRSFTVSGSGLNKLSENYKHTLTFFQGFATGTDTIYTAYMDAIDDTNVYAVFEFQCYISSLTLESTIGSNSTYSFTLQGTGPFVQISDADTYTVTSGSIPGRNTSVYRLLGIGYDGEWHYNFSVINPSVGVYTIVMGSDLNGKSVRAVYKTL
jgi:hypothetical protein